MIERFWDKGFVSSQLLLKDPIMTLQYWKVKQRTLWRRSSKITVKVNQEAKAFVSTVSTPLPSVSSSQDLEIWKCGYVLVIHVKMNISNSTRSAEKCITSVRSDSLVVYNKCCKNEKGSVSRWNKRNSHSNWKRWTTFYSRSLTQPCTREHSL